LGVLLVGGLPLDLEAAIFFETTELASYYAF
jgi:hypothetical protein